VEEGGELRRGIEAFGGKVVPRFLLEDAPVELILPVNGELLTLRVVVCTGESH